MCGIAGTICINNNSLDNSDILKKMVDMISNRGPDGTNVSIIEQGKIGLAHARLAIIDLSEKANQPMCDSDAAVHIVFNGEIYNYQEIKQKLDRKKEIKWKTDHSDTEVVIEAYKAWGIDCISEFIGMFAFALWDGRTKKMYLVRDRLGIKPLYYSIMSNKVNFASNIKALLQDPEQDKSCDKKGIFDFLSLLAVPAPNTLFKSIKKLPAGYFMEIDLEGAIRQENYWDAANYIQEGRGREGYYKKQIVDTLRQSVDLRKISDVPIGIFLSGGVDSTTNLALFAKNKRDVKTFTVGYKNTKKFKNESFYAKEMAVHYGAEFNEVVLEEKDILDYLLDFGQLLDDPVADPVMISQYFIAAMARKKGIKVMQVGEGADELFGGYLYWEEFSKLEKMRQILPKCVIEEICKYLKNTRGMSRLDAEIFRRCLSGQPVFWGSRIYINEDDKRTIFSNAFLKEIGSHETYDNFRKSYHKYKNKSGDPLTWMTYVTTKFRLPDLLLARSDKACMEAGVEARVPFLDHRMVEICMSLPGRYKIKRHTTKYILKKSVAGIIPASVIDRKKEGFSLPFFEWYRGDLGIAMRRDIAEFVEKSGFFNKAKFRSFMSQNHEAFVVWAMYVLARWWKEFIYETG